MNVLEVRPVDVVIEHLSCDPVPSVDLWVDGRPLHELVLPAEAAALRSVGDSNGASGYLPMAVCDILGPAHYLGSPIEYWRDPGATALLGCNCGEWACSPLTARVQVGGRGIAWVAVPREPRLESVAAGAVPLRPRAV